MSEAVRREHPGWREAVKAISQMSEGDFVSTRQIAEWFDAEEETQDYRLQWMGMTTVLRREHGICLTRVRVNDEGKSGYTIATNEEKVRIHNRRWKKRMVSGLRGLTEVMESVDPEQLSDEAKRKLEHDVLYAGRMLQMHALSSGRKKHLGEIRLVLNAPEDSEDGPAEDSGES